MNYFTNYEAPPETEESYLAREEEIERQTERHYQFLHAQYDADQAQEPTHIRCEADYEEAVEAPVQHIEPQQGELFSEVADAA